MAKKEIIWTLKAIQDKLEILDYWITNNKSKTFSERLDQLFDKAIEKLQFQAELGKKTDYKNIRIVIVRHYLVYYLIRDQHIEVVRIWDARRNPKKFIVS
ncbi:MAG: type II toxin-antitoxin system RelE/ParE family toxin [Cyclobacteriaceae bacterium]|nr:type II toxin-antitoxin system RelE/ParE family toxin [Cyclobacteriaceae bacterium]